jgi:hypothetical protein
MITLTAKTIWKWLDGKKCIICTFYWSILTPLLPVMYNGNVPSKVNTIFTAVGLVMSAVGLGHAGVKAYSGSAPTE